MSSKVKSFWRISSASSPSVSAIASSTVRSVERPARLSSSASESTPPAWENSWVGTLESFIRSPRSTSSTTPGLVSSIVAMPSATLAWILGRQRAQPLAPSVVCSRRRPARSSAAPRRRGRSRSAPAGCGAGSRTDAARPRGDLAEDLLGARPEQVARGRGRTAGPPSAGSLVPSKRSAAPGRRHRPSRP